MFSFNCYICRVYMGDFPPIDTLTAEQSAIVGDNDFGGILKRDVLRGTPYEGMSTGSFCSFCIVAIQEFPSAIAGEREVNSDSNTVSNLYTHSVRHGIRARAFEMYPNANLITLSFLDSVFMEGIGYKHLDCVVPGCNNTTRTSDDGRWDHFHCYCSDHKGWYDLKNYIDGMTRNYWNYWWYAAPYHGHNWAPDLSDPTIMASQCNCNDCFDVLVEYWDIQREAHEQDMWEEDNNRHNYDEENN